MGESTESCWVNEIIKADHQRPAIGKGRLRNILWLKSDLQNYQMAIHWRFQIRLLPDENILQSCCKRTAQQIINWMVWIEKERSTRQDRIADRWIIICFFFKDYFYIIKIFVSALQFIHVFSSADYFGVCFVDICNFRTFS